MPTFADLASRLKHSCLPLICKDTTYEQDILCELTKLRRVELVHKQALPTLPQ
jgi:hypothetical protein